MSAIARYRKFRRRLRADAEKGSAAVEFAMIMPIFFVLLLGTMEAGIMFFAQFSLQNAVSDAGRLVRTGQAQSISQGAFKTAICNEISALFQSCTTSLQVDVESFTNYGGVNYAPPLKANGTLDTTLSNYNIGTACNVVLVRAFYTWPVWAPGLVWFMSNSGALAAAHLIGGASRGAGIAAIVIMVIALRVGAGAAIIDTGAQRAA